MQFRQNRITGRQESKYKKQTEKLKRIQNTANGIGNRRSTHAVFMTIITYAYHTYTLYPYTPCINTRTHNSIYLTVHIVTNHKLLCTHFYVLIRFLNWSFYSLVFHWNEIKRKRKVFKCFKQQVAFVTISTHMICTTGSFQLQLIALYRC